MVFSTMTFLWIFMPVVLILGILIRNTKAQNLFLLAVSLVFYAWGGPEHILLLLVSMLLNWAAGLGIRYFRQKESRNGAVICMTAGILCNVGILCYYKYINFLLGTIGSLTGKEIPSLALTLPVGISFFTFQAITYCVDVCMGRCKVQENFLNLALYLSFFPKMVSGPIVRYKDMEKELTVRSASREDVFSGFRRFLYGLSKKVLFANYLGAAADCFFSADLSVISSGEAWLGVICYGLQLYYDFSGYSDMAIGLARMFGFHFAENFNYPFLSASIAEFWRRWHISLGAWFREYIYFPLGGSRKGTLRTCLNLLIVFAVTGLWHGASWNFVIWGLYQGFFNVAERLGLKKVLDRCPVLGHIYCMLVIFVGWAFFRISDFNVALHYIFHMFQPWKYRTATTALALAMNPRAILLLVLGIAGCGILQAVFSAGKTAPEKAGAGQISSENASAGKPASIAQRFGNSVPEALFLGVCFVLCLLSLAGNTSNAFIYAKF